MRIAPWALFQLDNHLGTCCVEADENGAVISYEEFHPYGTSAYRAMKSGVEVSAKRYRYIGKERDDETGLYLMGARYYAAWLGRWTAADPAGTVDGTNLYAYVRGSPIGLVDPSGTYSKAELDAYRAKNKRFAQRKAQAERAKELGGIGAATSALEPGRLDVGNLGRVKEQPSITAGDYTPPPVPGVRKLTKEDLARHEQRHTTPAGPGLGPKPPRKPIWTGEEALGRYLTEENPTAGKIVEGVQFSIGFAAVGLLLEGGLRALPRQGTASRGKPAKGGAPAPKSGGAAKGAAEEEVTLWKGPAKEAGDVYHGTGPVVPRDPAKEVVEGFDPKLYPGKGPFFGVGEAGRAEAESWSRYYGFGLQRFHMSRADFMRLQEAGVIKPDQLYDPGVSVHVPPEGLSEFNRAILRGTPNKYTPPRN